MKLRSSKRLSLRGSVTQNKPSMRLDAQEGFLFSPIMRVSLVAGSLTLILGLALWLWHIGWPQRQIEHAADAVINLTQKAHFSVVEIKVEGRHHTDKDALTAALNTSSGEPILKFDPAAAATRIAKMPWVNSVTVERRLPDTIMVHLVERVPLARWQHDGRIAVVDEDGRELPEAPPEQFANLPLVVGAGASVEAKNLITALREVPVVTEKMTAATWVGLRRWDLYLQPKIVVHLQEGHLEDGLKRLADLITDDKVLERNPASIDLRFPDRFVIEPNTPVPANHPAGEPRL